MFLKQTMLKTQGGAGNYYPNVVLEKSSFVYWGAHETTVYDVSANQAVPQVVTSQVLVTQVQEVQQHLTCLLLST